jgi:hypothetical protein
MEEHQQVRGVLTRRINADVKVNVAMLLIQLAQNLFHLLVTVQAFDELQRLTRWLTIFRAKTSRGAHSSLLGTWGKRC